MVSLIRLISHSLVAASLLTIVACGGGSGDGLTTGPAWTAGVFENENNFKNLCQTIRHNST